MRQSEIAERMDVSQQVVSYHLGQIRKRTEKEGVMAVFLALTMDIQESRVKSVGDTSRLRSRKPDDIWLDFGGEDVGIEVKRFSSPNYRKQLEQDLKWKYLFSAYETQTNYQNQSIKFLKMMMNEMKKEDDNNVGKKESPLFE